MCPWAPNVLSYVVRTGLCQVGAQADKLIFFFSICLELWCAMGLKLVDYGSSARMISGDRKSIHSEIAHMPQKISKRKVAGTK